MTSPVTEYAELRLRGMSADQWSAANPVLGPREPGYETDTRKIKVGDGATAWNSLSYIEGSASAPASSGTAKRVETFRRSTGDFTISATTRTPMTTAAGVAVDAFDLVLPAVAGDRLLVGIDVQLSNNAGTLRMDAVTIVPNAGSVAPGTTVSAISGLPATQGVPGWVRPGGTFEYVSGLIPYTVVAGDVSGGLVRLRPTGKVDSSSRLCAASSTSPFTFFAQNTGQ